MPLSDDLEELSDGCEHCGNHHFYSYECRYDLHGEEDCFKTSCSICETEIPSGAPREGDRFGNLYCSTECAMVGHDKLLDISMTNAQEAAERAG